MESKAISRHHIPGIRAMLLFEQYIDFFDMPWLIDAQPEHLAKHCICYIIEASKFTYQHINISCVLHLLEAAYQVWGKTGPHALSVVSPEWPWLIIIIIIIITIIIIIIAPLSILSEDEWGDLECMYKACQVAITDGGLIRDNGVDERIENDWDDRKPLARPSGQRIDKSWCKRLRGKGLFKEKTFEFRVKLMRGQGKWRRISSCAEWWRRRRLPQLFG